VLDYVRRDEKWAGKLLGKIGVELWKELRGEAVYELAAEEKDGYASISKTKTFTPPSNDKSFVSAQLLRNVESAFIKLRRHRLRAKRIAVFLRTQDYRSWGLEGRLDRATSSILEVTPLVKGLFEKTFREGVLYRLTGVVLSKLEEEGTSVQYSLFDDVPKIASYRAIDRVIDSVNEHYGKHTLHLGTTLFLKKHSQHLSERGDLPVRKQELMKGETKRQRLAMPVWKVRV
jgi:DNA polymerase-4/DNA polymerase V